MARRTRYGYVAALVVACLVGALVIGAVAPVSTGTLGSPGKKRCHYAVKRVRGKKKRIRVCRNVKPKADLAVTVSDSPDPVQAGSELSYTVTIVNRGPAAATGVKLAFALPFDAAFFAQPPPLGTMCDFFQTRALCTLPRAIKPRSSYSLTPSLVATPPLPGTVVMFVNVRARQVDPNPRNDQGQTSTTVTGTCDPSYPTVCIPPPPPDLNCSDIAFRNFTVRHDIPNADPHWLDGDNNGVGCETFAPPAANVAPNPSFEVDCGGLPCKWSNPNGTTFGGTLARDTTVAHRGNASLRQTANADWSGGPSAASACIAVTADTDSTRSFWYRTSSPAVTRIHYHVSFYVATDCSGEGFGPINLVATSPVATGQWVQVAEQAGYVLSGARSAVVSLFFKCASPCASTVVNFDDVTLGRADSLARHAPRRLLREPALRSSS